MVSVDSAPFQGVAPLRYLWVSPTGSPAGDGSQAHPFSSIQTAVNHATPGTAIMVSAGTYVENIKLPNTGGTATAPIWLISADGPQAAHIVAADTSLPVIKALGTDNVVIDGFQIQNGYYGIQFNQSGNDYHNLVNNIVVENNLILNSTLDGIKVGEANNAYALHNTIVGAGDQGIDFLAVDHGVIANNDISNITGPSALLVKGGATDVLITGNTLHHIKADGISIGGWTEDAFFRPDQVGYYEAKDIVVTNNTVLDVGQRPLVIKGAIDSSVTGNTLAANPNYYTVIDVSTGYPNSTHVVESHNIDISGNTFNRLANLLTITQSDHASIDFHDNIIGSIGLPVGGIVLPPVPNPPPATVSPPPPVVVPPPSPPPEIVPPPVPPVTVTPPPAQNSGDSSTTPASQGPQPTDLSPSPPAAATIDLSKWVASASPVDTIAGTTGNDNLVGTANADSINGGIGTDTMTGGAGDDTYVVSTQGDKIVESAGGGIDTVLLDGTTFIMPDQVENLTIRTSAGAGVMGNALNNIITGGDGADTIIGGGGDDLLTGGKGNDVFVIAAGDGNDVITDFSPGDHIDLVSSPFASFAQLQAALTQNGADAVLNLGGGQTLTFKGIVASNLTSDNFDFSDVSKVAAQSGGYTSKPVGVLNADDWVQGTTGNDYLDGRLGNDVLAGGMGDDTYVVRTGTERIVESANGGTDTVLLQVKSYTLPAHVENLTTSSSVSAVTINGNALANIMQGSAGADTIAGLGGGDVLTGAGGNDLFLYTKASDSSGAAYDSITDFNASADKLELWSAVTGIDASIKGTLSAATFDANLAAAVDGTHLAAHHAALFMPNAGTLSGQTFLVIDTNGIAGYQSGEDLVIRLQNPSHMTSFGLADFIANPALA